MDLIVITSTIFDFLKVWLPLAIILFILYKIISPLREKLAEYYEFSWIKSAAIINFLIIFAFLLIAFIYFFAVGALNAPIRDPALNYDFFDSVSLILVGVVRIAIASVILTAAALFFEMIAALVMDSLGGKTRQSSKKNKNKNNSSLLSQFAGVLFSTAIFVILLLFVFSWVPLGLFIFIFYGGVSPLPLLLTLI